MARNLVLAEYNQKLIRYNFPEFVTSLPPAKHIIPIEIYTPSDSVEIKQQENTLPKTIAEVRENISRVSGPSKPGVKKYLVAELVQIANNLGIPSNGKKKELASRIVSYVNQDLP